MMRAMHIAGVVVLVFATPTVASQPAPKPPGTLRVATFNASLNREAPGRLLADLESGTDPQIRNVAEIIQRVAPDILLINEFDHDPTGRAVALFQKNYLGQGQNGAPAIDYPFSYAPEVNTGESSGLDLDNDGTAATRPGNRDYGNDAFGFGLFPGQYGMVLLSRFPIDTDRVMTFRKLLWRDMPGALLPKQPDGAAWFDDQELTSVRLSSKTHAVVPVTVGGQSVDLLISHPTPPAFDGPERRNQRRNHDEIRLWVDLLGPSAKNSYLRTDTGSPPRPISPRFVILGDLNADPNDGASWPRAIAQLLEHPRVDSRFIPVSQGAVDDGKAQGQSNSRHRGDAAQDTADFADRDVGNLRVDYVLPSRTISARSGGVFWPTPRDPLHRLVKIPPAASSDHRLVYVDLDFVGS